MDLSKLLVPSSDRSSESKGLKLGHQIFLSAIPSDFCPDDSSAGGIIALMSVMTRTEFENFAARPETALLYRLTISFGTSTSPFIARSEIRRSAGKRSRWPSKRDCFAALAMTTHGNTALLMGKFVLCRADGAFGNDNDTANVPLRIVPDFERIKINGSETF